MKLQLMLAASLLAVLSSVSAGGGETLVDPQTARADDDGKTLWYDVRELGLEGQGWQDLKAPFDRLPARAEGTVRDAVWNLSRHAAGLCVRFETDAPQIRARWTLTSSGLAMPHMPATGVSGLDLYVRADDGQWRWLGVGRPTNTSNEVSLASGIPAGVRQYWLYLPLYNGVSSVELGLPQASALHRLPRAAGRQKPIVFYGTSITQGGCASRPGMVHTAILGRRLDRPVINLGFSGNGRMEIEVARLLGELDAAVYVIDCLPNIAADAVTQRTEPLVREIRRTRPETPMVLVEDRTYADAFLIASKRARNEGSRQALQAAFGRLRDDGVPGLFYLAGAHQLGDDGEATVDSSHPTDLGFLRMADAFEPVLREALGE